MTTIRSLASVPPFVMVQQIVSLLLTSITLVSAMPEITTEPESLIHLRQGSLLTLKCSATGDGSPQIYWQKLGSRFREQSGPNSSVVKIDQVTLTAAGTWVCYATDRYGTSEKSVVVFVSSELICVECESDQEGCGESMTPAQVSAHSRFCTEIGDNICMKVKVNSLRTSWTSKNGRLEVATTKISRFCGKDTDYRWGGCWFQYGKAGESWTCACRGDSCNGADTLTSPLTSVIVLVIVTSSLSWGLL